MRSVVADKQSLIYDDVTDVMYIPLGKSRFTDEDEIAPGFHVLYAYDGKRTDRIVGVEIEYFKERYGESPTSVEVLTSTPFAIHFSD